MQDLAAAGHLGSFGHRSAHSVVAWQVQRCNFGEFRGSRAVPAVLSGPGGRAGKGAIRPIRHRECDSLYLRAAAAAIIYQPWRGCPPHLASPPDSGPTARTWSTHACTIPSSSAWGRAHCQGGGMQAGVQPSPAAARAAHGPWKGRSRELEARQLARRVRGSD